VGVREQTRDHRFRGLAGTRLRPPRSGRSCTSPPKRSVSADPCDPDLPRVPGGESRKLPRLPGLAAGSNLGSRPRRDDQARLAARVAGADRSTCLLGGKVHQPGRLDPPTRQQRWDETGRLTCASSGLAASLRSALVASPVRISLLSRRDSLRLASPILGAAVLTAVTFARLPRTAHPFEAPRTPFDGSASKSVASGFALLRAADGVIPRGAIVVARTEPRNPAQETYFHRFALALLAGREVLPAAYYGMEMPPEVWNRAQYVVVFGKRPADPPGRLLLITPNGTVWKLEP
jgi:hypothetical protein